MLEAVTLITFAGMLGMGIACDLPLLGLLLMGWLLFFDYGLVRGYDMGSLLCMSGEGLQETVSVLLLFALIGALTASWRAAGTIAAITSWSVHLVTPATLVPATFLLCGVMSLLTGSSFAAAATTGVICMSIATSLGAPTALVGGALVSGCFLGDHCSPMSSTASLVAHITETRLFDNVNRMMRMGVLPFALCCVAYVLLGRTTATGAAVPAEVIAGVAQVFRSFDLSPVVLAPVVVVFVLCLARVNVRAVMTISLLVAVPICVKVQGMTLAQVAHALVWGFHAADPSIAHLTDGGGVASMGEIAAIVAVASTYAGLFRGTGLLDGLGRLVSRLARRTTPFVGVLVTSVITTAIACDQVVAIMLVRQLCDRCERAERALALDIESSVALIPALIPWSTSCVSIVAFTGMPVMSVLFALLPLLVPAWYLGLSLWQHRHPAFVDGAVAHALGLNAEDDARRMRA